MEDEYYNKIGKQFTDQYGTTVSKMFGTPCLKTGKKAFAAFFKGAMIFKLGQQEVNLLLQKYQGSQNWDPSGKGRAMKDWLEVPPEFKNDWANLAQQALGYVEQNK